MRRRFIRPIERFERLENRTCPSVSMSGEPIGGMEDVNGSSSVKTDSDNAMYEWIMMVMVPDDMMRLTNEYDQSAKSPGLMSGETETGAMSSDKVYGKTPVMMTEASMNESSEMPPAQMIMAPEPLVRPGSSSSSRSLMPTSEMAESMSNEEKTNSAADQRGSMSDAEKESNGEYEPPRLAPGDLDPVLTPNLDAGAIGPALEKAIPSEEAPR